LGPRLRRFESSHPDHLKDNMPFTLRVVYFYNRDTFEEIETSLEAIVGKKAIVASRIGSMDREIYWQFRDAGAAIEAFKRVSRRGYQEISLTKRGV
jgi:hypothetical protein